MFITSQQYSLRPGRLTIDTVCKIGSEMVVDQEGCGHVKLLCDLSKIYDCDNRLQFVR